MPSSPFTVPDTPGFCERLPKTQPSPSLRRALKRVKLMPQVLLSVPNDSVLNGIAISAVQPFSPIAAFAKKMPSQSHWVCVVSR